MASTTASVGKQSAVRNRIGISKDQIFASIGRLFDWLEKNDYKGYDTFDGLSARYVRWLTFENKFLRQVLQQGIRRFPFNTRPILGVKKDHASKAMGYFAKGFIRLHQATGEQIFADKAQYALQWLIDNPCKGYSGACWGNHFDYQSRSFYMDKSVPTIVWTSHIGHAFLDAYEHFGIERYLEVAASACEHIVRDLEVRAEADGVCISYVPTLYSPIHNSNTLGASLLARTYSHTRNESYQSLAQKAMQYAANHQRENASWYYGEKANLHWVDNFHTAYVLDCFKYYAEATGDRKFDGNLGRGYDYWKKTFFLEDGTPRYYDFKKLPLDIQCSSQAIDTLVFFSDHDPDAIPLALKVAKWTIDNMQDSTGYFYYRRYALGIVNTTATLHWGQATMLSALSGLYKLLQ